MVTYPLLFVHCDILPDLFVNVCVLLAVVVPVFVVYPAPFVNWLLFVILFALAAIPFSLLNKAVVKFFL